MKALMPLTLAICLGTSAPALSQPSSQAPMSTAGLRAVAPGLERFSTQYVDGALWERTDLSARDRSIVTLSALIARQQMASFPEQVDKALANGVTPAEISELITHLAFYAGWGNALSAVSATRQVFERHGVRTDDLPAAQGDLLPLDDEQEAAREARVASAYGEVSPGVVQNTTDLLFRDLWLRPGLAPRDRSLVTVSSLVALGQVAQAPVHLNKAMDNGLTQAEASEVLTHLAFHAGWPNVFSALPVFKEVFAKRSP